MRLIEKAREVIVCQEAQFICDGNAFGAFILALETHAAIKLSNLFVPGKWKFLVLRSEFFRHSSDIGFNFTDFLGERHGGGNSRISQHPLYGCESALVGEMIFFGNRLGRGRCYHNLHGDNSDARFMELPPSRFLVESPTND
jgi:hypothetical protein